MVQVLMTFALLGQTLFVPGPDNTPIPSVPLFNKKPEPFVAPGRLFSVQVPPGWGIALHDDDPYTIDFRGVSRPGFGIMQVRRITVPKGAHPRQLILNAIEMRLKKLPNFNIAGRRDVKVGGHRAAAVTGTFSYQGNLQYPVAIEEVHVVTGREAFIFHFECFGPEAGNLANDVNTFYTTFAPRPAGTDSDPFGVPEESGDQVVPELRF
jgi:hypothetical protein